MSAKSGPQFIAVIHFSFVLLASIPKNEIAHFLIEAQKGQI